MYFLCLHATRLIHALLMILLLNAEFKRGKRIEGGINNRYLHTLLLVEADINYYDHKFMLHS